jgi:hypothetical protein
MSPEEALEIVAVQKQARMRHELAQRLRRAQRLAAPEVAAKVVQQVLDGLYAPFGSHELTTMALEIGCSYIVRQARAMLLNKRVVAKAKPHQKVESS